MQGSEENLGLCLLWGIRGWEPTLGVLVGLVTVLSPLQVRTHSSSHH